MPLKSRDIRKILEESMEFGEPLILMMHRARLVIAKKILHEVCSDLDANQMRFLRRADCIVATVALFRTEEPSIVVVTDLAPQALFAISEFRDVVRWLVANWGAFHEQKPLTLSERESMERLAAISDEQLVELQAMVKENGMMIVPSELFEAFSDTAVMGFQALLGPERTHQFGMALLTACGRLIKQVRAIKKAQS